MAVERVARCARKGRGRADSLPVLRWLQVGAAAAGVGVALVAAPGLAQADTGTTSASATSSQGTGSSADSDSDSGTDASPGAGGAGEAADDAESSSDVSGSADVDAAIAEGEDGPDDALGALEDDTEDLEDAADADPVTDGDSADQPTAHTSVPADAGTPDDDDPANDTDGAAAVFDGGHQHTTANVQATTSTADSTGSPTSESPSPVTTEDEAIAGGAGTTRSATPITVNSPTVVAQAVSLPEYPDWVSAPVTWRSILIEGLSWLGLGALAPNLPVPEMPVPDLIAGLWLGMRRMQYTLFNAAPRLEHSGYTADPWTGVISGDLGGFDADGDVISYRVTDAPIYGTLLVADDGTYTYTPDPDFAAAGGTDTFTVVAEDTGDANRWHLNPGGGLLGGTDRLLNRLGLTGPAADSTATVSLVGIPVLCSTDCTTPAVNHSPTVTVHNNSENTIWVYNLTNSGNYSITDPPVVPISIPKGASQEVTLAVGTGALGDPQNRIYFVEGDTGFTLPVASAGGVDPFNPTAVTEGNSFNNYTFMEYFLYPANGGYEYTIDTSYIDEWSLPIQSKFTIPNGVQWTGAVSGTTYGFNDFDTVVSQLTAAGGPYSDLVWSGTTPWTPYPPDTVSRIIGPDKVWAEQSQQPPSNINMNNAGWVPTSYQDFVQYVGHPEPSVNVSYAYNGNAYSATMDNFDFWKHAVTAPAGTPYPIALRTSAKLDGFPGVNGVWGFFTYPNDEAAGQFTNIPTAVSMDIYVHGSADGVSDSVITGGKWLYSSSPTRSDADLLKPGRNMLVGTDSTDTFILDYIYKSRRSTPLVIAQRDDHDIVAIDKTSLPGAISNDVDIVDCFWPGGIFANYDSQFIYDRSSGLLYYDEFPGLFGYTGILANLSLSQIDPSDAVFVL